MVGRSDIPFSRVYSLSLNVIQRYTEGMKIKCPYMESKYSPASSAESGTTPPDLSWSQGKHSKLLLSEIQNHISPRQ
jgi:hypothetical protein